VSDAQPERALWSRYEPVGFDQPGTMLRVPYPGYVAELRAAYGDGRRAHEVSRSVPYRLVQSEPADPHAGATVQGPFQDLLVFGFNEGESLSGDRVVQVTSMLRKAVFDRMTDLPPAVSGHGADGRNHVAFLGLPNAGYDRSDGRLLGVALALPETLTAEERRGLLNEIVINPMRRLRVDRATEVEVRYDPSRAKPVGLLPERWMSTRRGARTWVTATPLMLDRFPKGRDDPAQMVARALVVAGYPEANVEVSPGPLAVGALHGPRPGSLPEKRPRRPLLHARVTFPTPVRGPVLAGSMRYLGLGLFMPARPEALS
jgi:CRISPR-associated protein Csb2